MMRKSMALALALTGLTACDYAGRRDVCGEHEDRGYRAAMEDYRAGRIDAAIAGFEKAVRRDPANASARFQLACLRQDAKHDWLEAYFGYREYLLQQPKSDKAPMAKDRLALCEKEMAKGLATKYGLNDSARLSDELAVVRRELKDSAARIAQAEKNLGESQARVRQLLAERDRLVRVVKGSSDEDVVTAAPSPVEVRDLLEEEDETVSVQPKGDEVALLRKEGDEESARTSEILAPRLAATNRAAAVRSPPPKRASAFPQHPPTYVVQEGDTLYSVAKRFYGTIAVWKTIRDANKTRISMDNRLRAGDTIVLP